MAKSNRDLVSEVLDTLKVGLGAFIAREYKQFHKGGRYLKEMEDTLNKYERHYTLPDETALAKIDAQGWLNLMDRQWNEIFRNKFSKSERAFVNELSDARNDWAHQKKTFDDDEAYRIADTATRLLKAIGATKQAEVTRNIAQDLLHPPVLPAPKAESTYNIIPERLRAPIPLASTNGVTRRYTTRRSAPAISKYGVKLYWADKSHETVVGFSAAGYERWRDSIVPGTRMLIYETSRARGAQAIVSEVEVIEGFGKSAGLPTPTQEHDHPVRVKVIHRKGSVPLIPRDMVQLILEREHYPQLNDTWIPITEEQYREFLKFWEKP